MSTPSPIFLLFGSGPGIGLALARAFATTTHFGRIVLCSRNASHLKDEKAQVEAAARAAGREGVEVITFVVDLSDLGALPGKLRELEEVLGLGKDGGGRGELGCVWHNAASVRYSEVLTTAVEEVEEDMRVNALSLYLIAQWSIPHLLKTAPATTTTTSSNARPPSFLTTSSHLPESPMPILLSLSMAKAAAQNMILCLHEAFGPQIHFGILKVCGLVSEDAPVLNPTEIAKRGLEFWSGGMGRTMVEIR